MPEALWSAAVSAAREHGVWAVARGLRVNYESLRTRVEGRARRAPGRMDGRARFVELEGARVLGVGEPETVALELSRPDGARMTIRLSGRTARELPALLEAFFAVER